MPLFDWQFPYPSRRMPVLARNVVATSQPLAAQAGLQMLARGGNAVDAAIACAATLTLVEPCSNGIGSDAFAIVWDGARLHGLNASGRSPAAWTPGYFGKYQGRMPERGVDSITVPGAVSAWQALHERWGALPFADLLEPAIRYASDGFLVSPTIARLWAEGAKELATQPGYTDCFLPHGRAPRAGEAFRSPGHAATLRRIADTKGEDFYRGELALRIAGWIREHGGAMAASDLAEHRADWVEPIGVDYQGLRLHELPPNGQGIGALIALGILEHLGVREFECDSADCVHLQIEAMKLAFADLYAHVSDPATMRVGPADLLDPAYLRERSRLIDRKRAQNPGHGEPPRGGTVYLTAADASGRMVSFIQSNYKGFGSGVVVPGTGISLQNRGWGFKPVNGHANEVGPRKRPFHTIIPGFVSRDGQPLMSFGVMGGSMQAQGHTQMMVRLADYRQNPQAAVDAPRWRIDEGLKVGFEAGHRPELLDELSRRGHQITIAARDSTDFGRAQLIYRLDDGYCAGSEPRCDGQAVGF
jgi:gamma-glutamyltranspeptidase/glutathione hydrolase